MLVSRASLGNERRNLRECAVNVPQNLRRRLLQLAALRFEIVLPRARGGPDPGVTGRAYGRIERLVQRVGAGVGPLVGLVELRVRGVGPHGVTGRRWFGRRRQRARGRGIGAHEAVFAWSARAPVWKAASRAALARTVAGSASWAVVAWPTRRARGAEAGGGSRGRGRGAGGRGERGAAAVGEPGR